MFSFQDTRLRLMENLFVILQLQAIHLALALQMNYVMMK